MPRSLRILLIFAATTLVCGLASLAFIKRTVDATVQEVMTDPLRPREEMIGWKIPEFSAVAQDGRAYSHRDLDGQVTILSFIFTHCPLACPAVTFQVKTLTDQLKDSSTRFLTMSMDPAHDTPALLKKWGDGYSADFQRWTFVNAGPGTHDTILQDHLHEYIENDPSLKIKLEDGSEMDNIKHPLYVYLIGPERQVIDRYYTKRPEDMAALVARARIAASKAAKDLIAKQAPSGR